MIGIAVTLSIAMIVLVHGIRVGRRTRAVERRADCAAVDRARTEVGFLDVVDGWFTLPESRVRLVADLHRAMLDELEAGDETAAAARARDVLQVLAPYHRVDIVDA